MRLGEHTGMGAGKLRREIGGMANPTNASFPLANHACVHAIVNCDES